MVMGPTLNEKFVEKISAIFCAFHDYSPKMYGTHLVHIHGKKVKSASAFLNVEAQVLGLPGPPQNLVLGTIPIIELQRVVKCKTYHHDSMDLKLKTKICIFSPIETYVGT